MKRSIIILFFILATTQSCTAGYRSMHSFETVWRTVNQAHYDPTFGGVDWKAAHEEYKLQIAAAGDKEESLLLINQMLFELNLSHLLAVHPEDMKKYMPVLFAGGEIGVDVRLLDGQAVITYVRSGTPAAQAGLQPGLVIERIDGKPVDRIIKEGEALLIPPFNPRNRKVEYRFDPAPDAYPGPVVILMDVRSTSSSEYFAGSMQSLKRAVIVGERSPGYLLIANWKKLLNGTSFMYAFAQPIMPDGTVIEGHGVVPDIEVRLDRAALLAGEDTQLEAAVNYLASE